MKMIGILKVYMCAIYVCNLNVTERCTCVSCLFFSISSAVVRLSRAAKPPDVQS